MSRTASRNQELLRGITCVDYPILKSVFVKVRKPTACDRCKSPLPVGTESLSMTIKTDGNGLQTGRLCINCYNKTEGVV